jgi:hypothetical protein
MCFTNREAQASWHKNKLINMSMLISENPLPVQINYDWQRLRRVYHKLIENYHHGFFDRTQWNDKIQHTACDLGRHGQLVISDNITEGAWIIWTGGLLDSILPWAKEIRHKTKQAGIFLQDFAFHYHYGDITRHTDKKTGDEIDFQNSQCNLNFVVSSSDPESTSYFERPDGVHCYVGRAGFGYLIDSSVPHWVENKGHREVFQIKFHSSYDKVKDFFSKHQLNLS